MNKILKVDFINILLISISAFAAAILPFQLFIFSYAILGPLHYFTEISWLKEKDFFLTQKDASYILFFAIFTAVILLNLELIIQFGENVFFYDKKILSAITSIASTILIFLTFSLAFILVFITDNFSRIIAFILAIFLAFFLFNFKSYIFLFAVFLTTIVHVWLFTAIFMVSGAIKAKKISSYLTFLIFLFASCSFLFIDFSSYEISNKIKEIINISAINLNKNLADFFNFSIVENDFFSDKKALKIQSFIAFAYSYHYLNWFSKVDLIKWHQVAKSKLIICLIFWILAILLYLYNFKAGLMALFFFSLIHVLLEFPLNFRSFSSIFSFKN